MKILHVIAQQPAGTGSGVYYSNVIEELKKYGHEQAALFACQDDYDFPVLAKNSQYPVYFKSAQLPFPIAGMSDVMPYASTVYSHMSADMLQSWLSAFAKALERAKAEFNPDIVILHHLWILTSMAAEVFADTVKIGVCHNTDIRQAEQHPELKNKYVTKLNKLNAIFSLSDSQKQRIFETFGIEQQRIITIGGGYDQKIFFPAGVKKEKKVIQIVYSAKIEESKGVFELVKAFKKISKSKPGLHLDIIGYPNQENARTLNSLIGNAANIAIVPIKCQKALADYIREKDIFAMPSYFEGLGLMAIECLASALRVVATEIEGLMCLLGDTVNNSGVIEYVKLPRIFDTDKPFREDLEMFVENLSVKLLTQIDRVEKGEPFPNQVISEINRHSWGGVAARIDNEITRLITH